MNIILLTLSNHLEMQKPFLAHRPFKQAVVGSGCVWTPCLDGGLGPATFCQGVLARGGE